MNDVVEQRFLPSLTNIEEWYPILAKLLSVDPKQCPKVSILSDYSSATYIVCIDKIQRGSYYNYSDAIYGTLDTLISDCFLDEQIDNALNLSISNYKKQINYEFDMTFANACVNYMLDLWESTLCDLNKIGAGARSEIVEAFDLGNWKKVARLCDALLRQLISSNSRVSLGSYGNSEYEEFRADLNLEWTGSVISTQYINISFNRQKGISIDFYTGSKSDSGLMRVDDLLRQGEHLLVGSKYVLHFCVFRRHLLFAYLPEDLFDAIYDPYCDKVNALAVSGKYGAFLPQLLKTTFFSLEDRIDKDLYSVIY